MEPASPKRKRNWWIPAFFVALIAFEFAREFAVIESASGAVPNARADVFGHDGYVVARGQWERMDGGELVAALVTIECWRERAQCVEAWFHVDGEYVYPPDLDRFEANFAPDAVTYQNTRPVCVTYTVRIDLRMDRVLALREKKPNVNDPICRGVEPRLEMTLADSHRQENPLDGHFVPLLSVLRAVLV